MRIKLAERDRRGIAISAGDQQRVPELSIFAGLVDRHGLLQQGPEQDAGVASGFLPLAGFERDVDSDRRQRFQQGFVENELLLYRAAQDGVIFAPGKPRRDDRQQSGRPSPRGLVSFCDHDVGRLDRPR